LPEEAIRVRMNVMMTVKADVQNTPKLERKFESMLKVETRGPCAVPHNCNPSYSRDGDRENRGLRPAWQNCKTPSQPIKAGVVTCLSSQLSWKPK
jgi:hypothetical protein